MVQATWNGAMLAESDETIVVEGNHYFPPNSLDRSHLADSKTTSHCPWKGEACYYTVIADGEQNPDAAWYYPAPKEAAADIKDRVAFWKGVQVA